METPNIEPPAINACPIYMSTPLNISCIRKNEKKAIEIPLNINAIAQRYYALSLKVKSFQFIL